MRQGELVYNGQSTSGDWDSDGAGTQKNGGSLLMLNVEPNTLSCLATVEAETDTLTITGKWQVSNDTSTWVDAVPQNNAAQVVLATGTAGSDSPASFAVEAPPSVYGWRYSRYVVTNGAATGGATDTYALGYCYERADVL
jgi:hypothetical protein